MLSIYEENMIFTQQFNQAKEAKKGQQLQLEKK